MKATIHCDGCGKDLPNKVVADYHNQPCLDCGFTPLVNDEELAVANMCDKLEAIGFLTSDPEKRKSFHGAMEVTIDTAPSRKKSVS